MSCILHIETSTNVCSVALSEDGKLLYHQEDFDGPGHSESSGVYVDEALSFANSHAIPVDAVAVSMGPGSYTGLRIGVSLAKGVCYGRALPLIAVPTLKVLCVPVLLGKEELPEDQKTKIEQTAQAILDARQIYPEASFADMYGNLILFPDLMKAHRANDLAVLEAYGFPKDASEAEIVARLFKMYQELT